MYAAQTSVAPPTFVLFTNTVTKLHFSYERFLRTGCARRTASSASRSASRSAGAPSERGDAAQDRGRARARARSPVKKGPGSPPTKHARQKAAYKAARKAGFKPPAKSWVSRRPVGAPAKSNGRASPTSRAEARRSASKKSDEAAAEAVGPLIACMLYSLGWKLPRWLHPSASSSRPRKSAKWCRSSRTCCGRGKRSFRRSARCLPAAARGCIGESDVELVLRIKQLVFDEGLTLSGARRRLDEDGGTEQRRAACGWKTCWATASGIACENVRTGLQSILQMLSKDGADAGELQLVPPRPAPRRRQWRSRPRENRL